MAATRSVTLTSPKFGEVTIPQLVFREPKMSDLIANGEPYIPTRSPDGATIVVENMAAIAGLASDCLIEPFGRPAVIDQLALRDALAVKDAIVGFFTDARSDPAPS